MSCKPVVRRLSQETQPGTAKAHQSDLQNGERPHADAEMTRVLKMAPVRIASDPSSGVIAYWKHDALHDVVTPMADHVLMTFPSGSLRFERRTGKSVVFGTARPGTVTVIPAGSTSRWDIPESLNVRRPSRRSTGSGSIRQRPSAQLRSPRPIRNGSPISEYPASINCASHE
jgi:AraC family transcriptional regulator